MITIATFTDFVPFYDRVRAHLMKNETAHILHLGFLESWTVTGNMPEGIYMACAEQDGETVAMVMRFPEMRAFVSQSDSMDAVQALAERLYSDQPDCPGLMGLKTEAYAFVERWKQLSGNAYHINRYERIYRLETLIPVSGVSGCARAGTLDDVEVIAQWLAAFQAEADPVSVPTLIEDFRKGAQLRISGDQRVRGMWVWEESGKVVCMVGYAGLTPNGIRIGPVYTPPDQRGHGYASALTAAVTDYLLKQGRKFVALFTDLANPTSNKIYQAIGYQPVTDVDEYVFTRVNS